MLKFSGMFWDCGLDLKLLSSELASNQFNTRLFKFIGKEGYIMLKKI
jgi:hypothetical protein